MFAEGLMLVLLELECSSLDAGGVTKSALVASLSYRFSSICFFFRFCSITCSNDSAS
jgi:hypothetical protein